MMTVSGPIDRALSALAISDSRESTQDSYFSKSPLQGLLETLFQAFDEILRVREMGFGVEQKSDFSPVTAADQASERVILGHLRHFYPSVPVFSEEELETLSREQRGSFTIPEGFCWFVDPLDGTREFVSGHQDFSVCIGLVKDGAPWLGLVGLPCTGEIYLGGPEFGSFRVSGRDEAGTRPMEALEGSETQEPSVSPSLLLSRSHRDEISQRVKFYLEKNIEGLQIREVGSSAKFCSIARGNGDFYMRGPGPKLWDVAAGAALILGSGGSFFHLREMEAPSGEPDTLFLGDLGMEIKPAPTLDGGAGLTATPFAALSERAFNLLRSLAGQK